MTERTAGALVEVDDAIAEAIREAVLAGVFWKAARLNVQSRETWSRLARHRHDRATALINEAVVRLKPANDC